MVKKFDVVLCDIVGNELPAVVVSPDEMNQALPYVMVAPLTAAERAFPTRLGIRFRGKKGQIALDMIQTICKRDIAGRAGQLPPPVHAQINQILKKMFGD
ncbi:MAG: type II toxin-antitoxin system PemK/MazF family toxin [Alphaproteobacteria bacterium]|nr:type II toxin-antitoxin system PemK/MazF family toxin [Alphaproteobacteria bacterium]